MRQRIGRQLGAVAVFASALIAISPTVAFAVPGATNALAEQTSHSTMVTPNQPSHAGFAAIPAYAGPSYHICLLNSTKVTYCIQSNGVGKQVTITSDKSNWSNFTDYATDLSISGEPVQRVENRERQLPAGRTTATKSSSPTAAAWPRIWTASGGGRTHITFTTVFGRTTRIKLMTCSCTGT